jgi:5-methylcytosine-specific restriction endonuclease McrA
VVCLECRRGRRGYRPHWEPQEFEPRTCVACLGSFTPKHPQSLTCSQACAKERKRALRRNQARYRREVVELSARLPDFLTVDLELAMRRTAKRCPMPGCGVKLTDVPFLPNSKELDHIMPRVLGGAHTVSNTRIICRLCNVRRPDDGSDITGQLDLSGTVR